MAAPVNDDILNAIALLEGDSIAGTTAEGTIAAGEVNYSGATSTVWYSYTPATTGPVAFGISNGTVPISLIVQSAPNGPPPAYNALQAVTDNFGGETLAPSVQFFAQEGRTYYIQVAGAGANVEADFSVANLPPDPAIDVTPPDAPVIATITDIEGAPVTDLATSGVLVFKGTGEVGSTINLNAALLPGGTAESRGTVTVDAEGNWTIQTPPLAEGSYSFGAVAVDPAGNASLTASQIFEIAIDLTPAVDTTPPEAPVIVAVANADGALGVDGISTLPVVILSGTAEANSLVTVFNGSDSVGTAQTNAEGAWSFETPALAEATYNFTATATDLAGNISPASTVPAGVTIDLPGPVAPAAPLGLALDPASDTDIAGDGITRDSTPTIAGTAADGLTITLFNGEVAIGTAAVVDGAWSITPEQALAAGSYSLTATATDTASGLSSSFSDALALTVTAYRDPAGFPAAAPAFDAQYYLAMNPDVAAAGADSLQHYLQFGWAEGRDPNALFDVSYYLNQNTDVAAAGIDPLAHYTQFGGFEGRDPSFSFDSAAYLAANADVAQAGANPLVHYLYYGQAEARPIEQATPRAPGPQDLLVDAQFYYGTYGDVAREGLDPSRHYDQFGWTEGRNPNAVFDTDFYLTTYVDVAEAGINPLVHYLQNGASEGRDPSAEFSTRSYLEANPDVAAENANALQHYLQFGIAEGRPLVPAPVPAPSDLELV